MTMALQVFHGTLKIPHRDLSRQVSAACGGEGMTHPAPAFPWGGGSADFSHGRTWLNASGN